MGVLDPLVTVPGEGEFDRGAVDADHRDDHDHSDCTADDEPSVNGDRDLIGAWVVH
jgi:hypothetical protein